LRILLVRLSAFGDVIHALPIAENASRAGATVAWLVESRYRELLEGNPNLERVFLADTRRWRHDPAGSGTRKGLRSLVQELRAFAPDTTIDVQGLWKSAIFARAAGAPVVGFSAGARRESSSAILSSRSVTPPPDARNIVDRNLALLSALGIPIARRAPDAAYLLARESPEAAAFLDGQPRPYALFHPGAGRAEKSWGEEKLAAVARELARDPGLAPALSWGAGDEARVDRMAAVLPGATRLPPLGPAGFAHVIAGAEIFVAGDTGPLHLADALGVRTLALFGPTDPDRNGPYRGTATRFDDSTTPGRVADLARAVLSGPPPAPPPADDPGPRPGGGSPDAL
jgi:lipopolysaccharide heptosyltransferase I